MCHAWEWPPSGTASSSGTQYYTLNSIGWNPTGHATRCVELMQAPDVPLDVLGAESQGQIGYLLESELSDELPESRVRGRCREVPSCILP